MATQKNQERAERAYYAICQYGNHIDETNLINLLSDAMHWCDARGEYFADYLRSARNHYRDGTNREE